MQKPPFCTPKTILLHGKNHTFVLRTCNIHRMNTLQTLREYLRSPTKFPTNTHENTQRTPRKISTNTPKTPNLHTARRRGRFIVPVSLHCQIRIFTSSNTCIRFIANTFLFVILWIYTDMRAR